MHRSYRLTAGGLLLGLLFSAPPQRTGADVTAALTLVAGTGAAGAGGEKVSATLSPLFLPQGLAFDPLGRLNLVEAMNHRVRRVGPSGKIVTVVGGNGQSGAAAAGY